MAGFSKNAKYGNSYPSQSRYPYSVFKPIPAGFFRQRVTIQQPVLAQFDGQGGVNEQWADLMTVWARIETIKDSAHGNIEKFEEMQLKYVQHYSVMLRWGNRNAIPILDSYRILYPSPANASSNAPYSYLTRILEIVSVVTLDVLNWQTNLYCREGGNIG